MPRVSSSNEAFKKVEQVVGRPAVTKDNINDLYVRDAPQNRSDSNVLKEHKQYYTPGLTRADIIADDASRLEREGDVVDEPLGRTKKTDAVAELVHENSVHQ